MLWHHYSPSTGTDAVAVVFDDAAVADAVDDTAVDVEAIDGATAAAAKSSDSCCLINASTKQLPWC